MPEIVLLGKGALAVRVAQWLHDAPDWELTYVVPVIPEPTWTDSLVQWCESSHVPYSDSGDYRDALHGEESLDHVLSVFYDRIIAADFIARCGRILNIHNAPLPRYRGVSPINWALKNREVTHGVTLHEIRPGIDDGPIVAQVTYSIYPDVEEVKDVYQKSLEYGFTLFQTTMPRLSELVAVPQDDGRASYYSTADNESLGDRRGFTRAESGG